MHLQLHHGDLLVGRPILLVSLGLRLQQEALLLLLGPVLFRGQPPLPARLEDLQVVLGEEEERDAVLVAVLQFQHHSLAGEGARLSAKLHGPGIEPSLIVDRDFSKWAHELRQHLLIDLGKIVRTVGRSRKFCRGAAGS